MARKKGRKGKKTASEMLESERKRVAKAVGRDTQRASEIMAELKNEFRKNVKKGGKTLAEEAEMGKEFLMKEEKEIEEYIKKNPFKAVGIAFIVGLLMGKMR